MKYKKFCDVCTHDEGARGIITRTASACATCGYGTLDWIDGQFGTHTHTHKSLTPFQVTVADLLPTEPTAHTARVPHGEKSAA